jgi:sterol desaturase/sphingolipid hydroxylase (fatty acid hydroxylase superfamily)
VSSVLVGPSRSPGAPTAFAGRRSREASRLWIALSSRVYLPAVGIAALAAVLVGIGWSDDWGGERFTGSLTSLRVVLVGPLALAIIGVFLVVERLWPAQPRPLFARGYRHDLLLTVMNATLVAPLVTALTLSFVEVVRSGLPWVVLPKIGILPRGFAIAVIVVAMDGLNWFVHLANHRVRMLWRFHELHHSQEDMSVLTVFRTHPLIHISYLLALIPGVVLLANGAASITVLVVYGGIVAFAHSNTRLGFGPLGRVFVSPNYHRIHHQLDGPQDVNLGFALTIWDQIFHCAVFPTEATVRIDTGLPGRPLTVEQSTVRPQHLSVLAAQLVAPFRPMRQSVEPPSLHWVSGGSERSDGRAFSGHEDLSDHRDVPEGESASW